jgi:putative YphP/YqiW family bacilliredoxin
MFQMQSLYPEELVAPMRAELANAGVEELKTIEDVDNELKDQEGTTLVIINSVCGCAAGSARPAAIKALENEVLPDKITTVFAGVDREATEQARSYILGYPPSSPSMALFKDGQVVHFIPRMEIEGQYPDAIAQNLKSAFDAHCK